MRAEKYEDTYISHDVNLNLGLQLNAYTLVYIQV